MASVASSSSYAKQDKCWMNTHGKERERLGEGAITMSYGNAAIKAGRDVGCNNSVFGDVTVNNYQTGDPCSPTNIASRLRSSSMNYLSDQENTHSLMAPNTLQWLFQSPEYVAWLGDSMDKHRSLACIGMPGAGKTVLASAVIEDLEDRLSSEGDSHVVLYLYFKHNRQTIQTRPIILANLLSQLVQMKETPSNAVLRFFNKYSRDCSVIPGPQKTLALLRSEVASCIKAYIVVDALDEFSLDDPSTASEIIEDLEGLPKAKILVTSRYEIPFSPNTWSQIDVYASRDDIRMFINNRIVPKSRLKKFMEKDPALKQEILDSIISKSEGMFIVARFIVDWILTLLTPNDIRHALKKLPDGIEGMYHLTMNRIWNQSEKIRMLAMYALPWVLLAKQELYVEELRSIVSFELQGGREMLKSGDLVEEEDILTACAGLLVKSDYRHRYIVKFVHFSTAEFLDKHRDRYFPNAKLRVMEMCLRYLLPPAKRASEDSRSKRSDISHEVEMRGDFGEYASKQWGYHALDVDGDERLDVQLIDEFFQHSVAPYLIDTCRRDRLGTLLPNLLGLHQTTRIGYTILLFANFGLCSMLKRYINADRMKNLGQREMDDAEFGLEVQDHLGRTPLYFAVVYDHSKLVKLLHQERVNVNATTAVQEEYNSKKWIATPLHWAVKYGQHAVGTALIEFGGKVNEKDSNGDTAIFYSHADRDGAAMFRLLLQSGADLNIVSGTTRNRGGMNLLHLAVKLGLFDLIRPLVERGIAIDSPDQGGLTSIMYAINYAGREAVRQQVVTVLLEMEADMNVSGKRGWTLLHQAAQYGWVDVGRDLVERGMDINVTDVDGNTPIWLAAREMDDGGLEMTKLLLEKGADVSVSNKKGETLLHRAAEHGWLSIGMSLAEKGIDVNALDVDGNPPIFLVFRAEKGVRLEVAKMLVEKGASINIANKDGDTALHRAVRWGHCDIVTFLLNEGMDIDLVDGSGNSPLVVGVKRCQWEVAQLLIERGADTTKVALDERASIPPSFQDLLGRVN